jgi:hypothetical protein
VLYGYGIWSLLLNGWALSFEAVQQRG